MMKNPDTTMHPWARQGSNAARPLGAARWILTDGLLLPAPSDVTRFVADFRSGKVENPNIELADVEAFLASPHWRWLQWAHLPESEPSDVTKYYGEDLQIAFGPNFIKPADLIHMYRHNNLLLTAILSGDDSCQVISHQIDEDNKSIMTRRVGMGAIELDTTVLLRAVLEEPSPLAVSLLCALDYYGEGLIRYVVENISSAGVDFADFSTLLTALGRIGAELDAFFEYLNEWAFDSYTEYEGFSDVPYVELYSEGVLDFGSFTRFALIAFAVQSRKVSTSEFADLETETLIDYFAHDVYNPRLIKNLLASGIDPQLAGAAF